MNDADLPLKSAPVAVLEILPPAAPGLGQDSIVPTKLRPEKGRQPRGLRLGAEVSRVRGYEAKRELIRLHVMEGKPLKECAALMGRNYQALHRVWRLVVEECSGARCAPEEHVKAVRAYCDKHLRAAIEAAQPEVGGSAAHGAVVIQGVRALCELHGVKPDEATGLPAATLEEVGKLVRVASPLLMDKLERVRAAKEGKNSKPGGSTGGIGGGVDSASEHAEG